MNKRIRVKFCGMTSAEDALEAARLGVDAIGLIFHEPSPRHVDVLTAKHIALQMPPYLSRVGVFVNRSGDFVSSVLAKVPLDMLQFHGQEPASYCRSFGRPYIKTIHVAAELCAKDIEAQYPDAVGFLFDTFTKEAPGGTGLPFDWQIIPQDLTKPILLAGGLTPDNVQLALTDQNIYAVDVTSGIEQIPGKKDPAKMARFMAVVMSYSR